MTYADSLYVRLSVDVRAADRLDLAAETVGCWLSRLLGVVCVRGRGQARYRCTATALWNRSTASQPSRLIACLELDSRSGSKFVLLPEPRQIRRAPLR